MRSQMRDNMRRGYRNHSSGGGDYEEGYRTGYKHGWDDSEEEADFRRSRGSDGRYR